MVWFLSEFLRNGGQILGSNPIRVTVLVICIPSVLIVGLRHLEWYFFTVRTRVTTTNVSTATLRIITSALLLIELCHHCYHCAVIHRTTTDLDTVSKKKFIPFPKALNLRIPSFQVSLPFLHEAAFVSAASRFASLRTRYLIRLQLSFVVSIDLLCVSRPRFHTKFVWILFSILPEI